MKPGLKSINFSAGLFGGLNEKIYDEKQSVQSPDIYRSQYVLAFMIIQWEETDKL